MRRSLLPCLALFGAMLAVPCGAADDMGIARLPVEQSPSDPAEKALIDGSRIRGGQPLNISRIHALSPGPAKARGTLIQSLRKDIKVVPILRELTVVRTVQLMDGHYELHQHLPALANCGYAQTKIDAIAKWRDSKLFDDKERALLSYIEKLVPRGDVDDVTFAEMRRHFSPREIIEVTMIAGAYVSTAMLTNAMRLQIDEAGRYTSVVTDPCG
jgi:alkylhydroperoxidase family enzyme